MADTLQHQTQFLKTKYGILHYEESLPEITCKGVIICVHGDSLKSTWHMWESALAPFSANGYRIMSFSMPGYGLSTGNRTDFRERGDLVISEIITCLKLSSKCIVIGRSVGGKSTLNAAAHDKRISHIVVTHPVVPPRAVLNSIRIPTMVTWARDDAGHPYAGPHGMRYLVKQLGSACKYSVSWNESDYDSLDAFYTMDYVQQVLQFLKGKPLNAEAA
eukprot:TRINITY_DN14633_c0_g1_i1.p1 TRINITY_DN14633_c0_g1~~TRINITY_DN14633_c0_g1_i1.p1  ORF type:complete len:218 (+),score=21.70 TRINITY_DN14633_c0_g1_i1:81-734(+)